MPVRVLREAGTIIASDTKIKMCNRDDQVLCQAFQNVLSYHDSRFLCAFAFFSTFLSHTTEAVQKDPNVISRATATVAYLQSAITKHTVDAGKKTTAVDIP